MTTKFSRAAVRGWEPLARPKSNRPARKVGSRSPRRPFGYIASQKMNGLQPGESRLELDNLCIHEADPLVAAYYPQPSTLSFEIDGENRRYTPDVLVVRHDGTHVIEEVKYRDEAKNPKLRNFHSIAAEVFRDRGYEFVVKTEDEIRGGPTLRNALLLLSHRSTELSTSFIRRLNDAFSTRLVWTMEELRRELALERWLCASMLNAIRCRYAIVDIHRPLDLTSVVRAPADAGVLPSPHRF